ncbi:hypothetical protein K469DRAFT_696798 [Zopfia rhizophila CBS 207.26]|uniref:Uncharacterized protein n=1 Tax=Zopfia rhizophila CBS 207.26 TaxID=1314779 RepID=A0A6A6ELR8_9PEZI|nr:hypothetical protein K469DRAFT_696798 [Zopfia rhizophila CBS 207.26]
MVDNNAPSKEIHRPTFEEDTVMSWDSIRVLIGIGATVGGCILIAFGRVAFIRWRQGGWRCFGVGARHGDLTLSDFTTIEVTYYLLIALLYRYLCWKVKSQRSTLVSGSHSRKIWHVLGWLIERIGDFLVHAALLLLLLQCLGRRFTFASPLAVATLRSVYMALGIRPFDIFAFGVRPGLLLLCCIVGLSLFAILF